MPIVIFAVACLFTLLIVIGMSFHLFRSLRDGIISVTQNQIVPDFTCAKTETPIIYWILIVVYAAILIVLTAGLAGLIILGR